MENDKIIYKLTVEDLQTVSEEELDRKLTNDEIKMLINPIAEKINWFDAIADSINEKVVPENH